MQLIIVLMLIFVITLSGCFANVNDEKLLQQSNEGDITTLLVIENRNRTRRLPLNRNQKVRPSIGLITSTVRTFINNDLTTEYTTEIYGTTLDHGKLYAQLLSTTSRIRNSSKTSSTEFSNYDFDNHIDNDHSEKPYFVFPTQAILSKYYSSQINAQTNIKYIIAETAEPTAEKLIAPEEETFFNMDEDNEVFPKRITPTIDLLTETVKNSFSPGEKSIINTKFIRQNRKILSRKVINSDDGMDISDEELKRYETVRYYGFADFTTIVGSTVIIFSPYTKSVEIDSILESKSTKLMSTTKQIPTTSIITEIKPTLTQLSSVSSKFEETILKNISTEYYDKPTTKITTNEPTTTENIKEYDYIEETNDNESNNTITEDIIQPTIIETKNTLKVPSEEDILKILASLAKISDNSENLKLNNLTKKTETNISGGSTTIFFDDYSDFSITENKKTNILSTITSNDNSKFETSKSEFSKYYIETKECATIKPTTTFKTITYFTTFFEDETSSSIETNIISTSEIDYETISCSSHIKPTTTLKSVSLTTIQQDFNNYDENEDNEEIELIFKTLYTTYTYLTTYFQNSTPSITSRKETVTNIITSTLDPNNKLDASILSELFQNQQQARFFIEPTKTMTDNMKTSDLILAAMNQLTDISPSIETVELDESDLMKMKDQLTTILTTYTYFTTLYTTENLSMISNRTEVFTNYQAPIIINPTEYSLNISKIVTNVFNSSSNGDKRLISEEDQLSLESNNNSETAPVLLIQTKYTTYTYYTTMYEGITSSNVVSRLETITDLVTETLNQNDINTESTLNSSMQISQVDYPITFFTTFTYWTTLFIDGSTTVTSQKETISSVSTPIITTTKSLETIKPTLLELSNSEIETTFFTTYTYYTTSYSGDQTIINSRLETVSNIIKNTEDIKTGRSIGPGVQNFLNEMIIIDNSSIINDKPIGILSRNYGTIIDADQISTVLYTTEVIGTIIDDNYVQAVKSTSTVKINEEKIKTVTPLSGQKTGLIRIINGTIVENETTTVYQSKVIGTIIDGKYAQIIESKSNFIVPTKTQLVTPINSFIYPTSDTIESSTKEEEENSDENTEISLDESDEKLLKNKKKSRLTYKPKKSNFSLQIRPFASRNRAVFNPKRRNSSSTIAATITRSDFVTPTVVATPVSKYLTNKKTPVTSSFRKYQKFTTTPSSLYNRYKSSRTYQNTKKSSTILSLNPTGSRYRIRPSAVNKFQNNKTLTITSTISVLTTEQNQVTYPLDIKQNELFTNTESTISKSPLNNLFKIRKPLNYLNQKRNNKRTTTTSTIISTTARTTTKSRLYTTRSRPINFFVPGRGFQKKKLNTTLIDEQIVTKNSIELNNDEFNDDDDNDNLQNEGSQIIIEKAQRRFDKKLRIRQKRQTYYSRFRRPITHKPSTENIEKTSEETVSIKPKNNLYTPRYRSKSRITPSKVSGSNRTPFTLRDNSRTNGYNRRTSSYNSKRNNRFGSTTPLTPNNNNNRNYRSKSTPSSNRRSSLKAKITPNYEFLSESDNDDDNGQIVITYHIPTETTIPVFNGKITEYKTIITANLKTETINPNQYYTNVKDDNKIITLLSSEITAVNQFGTTEVTKFLLDTTPTSSIIFTPTYIRGRKTTYSHLIPSTIYNVENSVTTVPSQNLAAAAQAPLANLLLSQLLLGGSLVQQTVPNSVQLTNTISTQYKTRTTAYVTTVTSLTSTVVPLIFRGRQILTTILDSSTNIITATEFITDTILVTPTAKLPDVQQLNSILLPLLIQQQQQQNPGLQSNDYLPYQNELLMSDIIPNEIARRKNIDSESTSVITVYVSGKKPGEFSTSLSTIYFGDYNEKNVQKREILATKTYNVVNYKTDTLDHYLDGRYGGDVLFVGTDEARHNLATRVMSNGVEVIVANDKTTLPGDPNIKLTMPSTLFKPITLSPSTLTNNMKMQIPQEKIHLNESKINDLKLKIITTTLDIDSKFDNKSIDCTTMGVIKTYFITYTHYNTMLINGKTTVMTNISTSSDIETDKLFIRFKKTKTVNSINTKMPNEEYNDVLKKIKPTKVEELTTTLSATLEDIRNTQLLEPSVNDILNMTSKIVSMSTPVIQKSKIETKIKNSKQKKIKTTKLSLQKEKTSDAVKEKIVNVDEFPNKIIKTETSNFENFAKIGSIGLQSLRMINPVLNIMTDIIKNNLRKQDIVKDTKKAISKPERLSPLITTRNNEKSKRKSPVYIPIHAIDSDVDESQLNETKKRWKNMDNGDLSETQMSNFGILISPGEVISANPDLIIGRPGKIGPQPPKFYSTQNLPRESTLLISTNNCDNNTCSASRINEITPITHFNSDPKSTVISIENPKLIIMENNNANKNSENIYKTGQYFDDPSPYHDDKIIPIVSDLDVKDSAHVSKPFEKYPIIKQLESTMHFENNNNNNNNLELKKSQIDFKKNIIVWANNLENSIKKPQSLPNNNVIEPFDYLTPPINQKKIIPTEGTKNTVMSKADDFLDNHNNFIINTTVSNEIKHRFENKYRPKYRPQPQSRPRPKPFNVIQGIINENQTIPPIKSSTKLRRKIVAVRKRPIYIPIVKLTTQNPIKFTVSTITDLDSKIVSTIPTIMEQKNSTNLHLITANYNDNDNDIETSTFWTTNNPIINWFKPNYTINDINLNEQSLKLIEMTTMKPIILKEPNNKFKEEASENSVIVISNKNHSSLKSLTVITPNVVYKTETIQLPKETLTSFITKYLTTTKTITITTTITETIKNQNKPPSIVTTIITKTKLETVVNTVTKTYTLIEPTTVTKTDISITTISATITPQTPFLITANDNVNWEEPEVYGDVYKHEINDGEDVRGEIKDEIINDDSIFVIVNSKNNTNDILPNFPIKEEPIQDKNKILLGGILTASFPSEPKNISLIKSKTCDPVCSSVKNEICIQFKNEFKCTCRNGFTRIFADQYCKPLYSFTVKLNLDKYDTEIFDNNTKKDSKLHSIVYDATNRMFKQSDLRDLYHGIGLETFDYSDQNGLSNTFYVQFTDNVDEIRLKDVLQKYIRMHNQSIGETKLKVKKSIIEIMDFNECSNYEFNDCSRESYCFNVKGSYTCSCRENYVDISENKLYPGRKCILDETGCEKCNFHGNCYSQNDNEITCECFAWYTGHKCNINLKIVLIGLLLMGSSFLILAIILVCVSCKPNHSNRSRRSQHNGINFLVNPYQKQTIDKCAMIYDSSSEYSQSDTLTILKKNEKKKMKKLKKSDKDFFKNSLKCDEKDRSLTVMIPRVRYHPSPRSPPLMNNITIFDQKKKSSIAESSNESKLLAYLDSGPRNFKKDTFNYTTNKHNVGALISAGFEVSATVDSSHFDTIEQDRSANTTLVHKISADLLSCSIEPQSNFNTFKQASK